MATSPTSQTTDFTRDSLGRFICNGLDEALRSAPNSPLNPQGSSRPDARDFDILVIGGGTFGSAIAEHMWFRDKAFQHRILVLEGGPFLVPEHLQNLPLTRMDVPDKTSIQDLRNANNFGWDKPVKEVWGLPWHSNQKFPGLAYCIGGRSLYWGGWSPELLDEEMPQGGVWPAAVVADLRARYFKEASDQIGVTQTNDFIFGELQLALRKKLLQGIGTVTDAIDPSSAALLDHPAVRYADTPPSQQDLARLLGLDPAGTLPTAAKMKAELKLEAPLGVQGQSGHAGFFPFNKFSSVQLLIKASRQAYEESIDANGQGDDVLKRLMVVPRCHVKRLVTTSDGGESRVTAVETNQGTVPLAAGGKVIVALATIESTRLALNSFQSISPDAYGRIGNNLLVHLRSNLNIVIPRAAAGVPATIAGIQVAALFLKGRHEFKDSNGNVSGVGHFHLQITASGGQRGVGSEAELFKKIPDIDTLQAHLNPTIPDTHVAITIRGIGETQPQNPGNTVKPDAEVETETGTQRVLVKIDDPRATNLLIGNPKLQRDAEIWNAMDRTAQDVAKIFAGATLPSVPAPSRDDLGTTHHETGTLWMGDALNSVTDENCKFRQVANAYVAGPALLPTIGSPNPMLTGIALARRLGDHLAIPQPYVAPDGFDVLFNGFDMSNWRMSTLKNQPGKPGFFRIINATLESVAGNELGLLWCTKPTPANFILKLEWLRWQDDANSGVFVRFPDPESKNYNNTAYVGVHFGFEVQIDEFGQPDGRGIHKTGAIYREDNREDNEVLSLKPARPVGQWNEYEIRVQNQKYTVLLNGDQVCVFDNPYTGRGLPTTAGAPSFIGLQCYPNPNYRVAFRRIRIKAI